MRYVSPPLPVDLTMAGNAASALQALQPLPGGGLNQNKIVEALQANRPKERGARAQHEAFGAGD